MSGLTFTPDLDEDSVEEIECPVCEGFGFLETEDEGSLECGECDGNGTIAP